MNKQSHIVSIISLNVSQIYETFGGDVELRRRGVWPRNTDGHQFLNVKIRYPFVIGREGDFAPVAQSVSASYL